MSDNAATTMMRTPGQMVALVFGGVYLVIGVIGFWLDPEIFGIFGVNLWHNIVHLALALVWLWGSTTAARARATNLAQGALLLVVAAFGFGSQLDSDGQIINLNIEGGALGWDNWLHAGTGLIALYFGVAGAARSKEGSPA